MESVRSPAEAISFQTEPYPDSESYAVFHPLVREWFLSKFSELAPPQRFSLVNIHQRINTLISSPTGSGKTLSAFAAILSELLGLAEAGALEDRVYCVYVSPLKALGNDIKKNLEEPLTEILALAEKKGQDPKRLAMRVAIRTGDTTPSEKARMLKHPPHILITTPESLAILLTTQKFRDRLAKVEWVIIDEIHSLADNKRGVHLALSLERLEELTKPCRIGLSATVAPLEEVARFLVGYAEGLSEATRPCRIVDVQYVKKLDLKVLSPLPSLIEASYQEVQDATYDLVDKLIQEHKTTLIFTNTRSATERVVHHLKDRYPRHYLRVQDTLAPHEREGAVAADEERAQRALQSSEDTDVLDEPRIARDLGPLGSLGPGDGDGEDPGFDAPAPSLIGAHHGSLSKEHRFAIEDRLRKGELRCVVCSTSLELGIDIGFIDLVILLGSPKSVARALQRIGRSGHRLHDEAKGRIIVLDRDDLVECSVLLKAAIERKIDTIGIPQNCLDVLAQQLYGMAIEQPRLLEDAYKIVRRCACYHTLTRADFTDVIRYLSGQYVSLVDRNVYAKIWYDEATQTIGKRGKMARVLYMTNIGTIPDQTAITVKMLGVGSRDPLARSLAKASRAGAAPASSTHPARPDQESFIGKIDESFLEQLKRGDVFVLGGNTYEFQYAQGMTVFVKTSVNRPPTVPRWSSEMLPLSFDLSLEIQRFRRYMEEHFDSGASRADVLKFIHHYLHVDENGALAIHEYLREQYDYALIPHDKRIVVEYYDEEDGRETVPHIVFHTLFGRRVNDVLSRALGFAIGKMTGRDVAFVISDNGFAIRTAERVPASRALALIVPSQLRAISEEAIEHTEVLGRRFRHCAARALMILRSYMGRHKSVGKQQMSSRLLISAVKRIDPNFPILKEARREVLEDLMDVHHAQKVLEWIAEGRIEVAEIETAVPSPFAFNLIATGYADIMKVEDKVAFLRRMHQNVLAKISLKKGKEGKAREKRKILL